MPIHGTSWLRTVTNRFCSCSTLLCFKLCSNAFGTVPGSAVKNTAVPSTRAGGLTNTASKKLVKSMASIRIFSLSSRRPSFQVIMKVNTTPPITSGNQPPANSFMRLDAKNAKSTIKKTPVAAMHNHSGYFQL